MPTASVAPHLDLVILNVIIWPLLDYITAQCFFLTVSTFIPPSQVMDSEARQWPQ